MAVSEYYSHGTYPATGVFGSSSALRSELEGVETGISAKLPDLSGNGGKIVAINSGASALEAITTTGTGSGVRATAPTLSAAVLSGTTNVSGGQLQFPASQSASADANTLDDYEEGDWTPSITFATAGDLSVTYSSQGGQYTKVGRKVTLMFNIQTSAFTHTTASGSLSITGLPFVAGSGMVFAGGLIWRGITKAGYTDVSSQLAASGNTLSLQASGSGIANTSVAAADMPTGGTVIIRGQITYHV